MPSSSPTTSRCCSPSDSPRPEPAVAGGLLPGSLPTPPTGIVGRDTEIATVGALLRDPDVHLVTLLGPGGIGKTRLAIEVAPEIREAGPEGADGVSFIDLSAVREPTLWPDAVTAALGVRPEGTRPVLDMLIDRVQNRPLLLVLDNVEQLVAAAADLSALLAACPLLTVLVTSRIVLGLRGEREVTLAPLTTPPLPTDSTAAVDIAAIAATAAVRLLVARAGQVRPGFTITTANAAPVAALCRRLDGIPLASNSPPPNCGCSPPRRCCAASVLAWTVRWTWAPTSSTPPIDSAPCARRSTGATACSANPNGPCSPGSVFTGPWTLEASDAVGARDGDLDALAVLASLIRQSLGRIDDSEPDEPRFRMLDTIRAYAGQRLAERDELADTHARLAGYLIDVVATVRDALQGAEHRAVADRLDRERDEIRSVIDWALHADHPETVAALLTPLFTYWWSRGLLPWTHQLAEQAALLPSAATRPPYPAALLSGARGMAMIMVGQTTEAEPLLRDTLDTATVLGNNRLRAYALLGLGWSQVHHSVGDAAQRLDEAAAVFGEFDDRWGLALTLWSLSIASAAARAWRCRLPLQQAAMTAAADLASHEIEAGDAIVTVDATGRIT